MTHKDVLSVGVIGNPRNLFNFSTAGQHGVIVINTTLYPSMHTFRDSNISLYEGFITPKSHAYQEHYDKRTPNLRAVLYWTTMIKIVPGKNTEIESTSSDKAGEYEVIIQGVTKEGKPVYLKEVFTNKLLFFNFITST